MTRPLVIEPLTPNGHVRTADLLTSIAKRLRELASPVYNGTRWSKGQHTNESIRSAELRRLTAQIEALAKSLEGKP